jgi:hypothetical protein
VPTVVHASVTAHTVIIASHIAELAASHDHRMAGCDQDRLPLPGGFDGLAGGGGVTIDDLAVQGAVGFVAAFREQLFG